MTHPHGIVTCLPQNQFRFTRAYITMLKVHTNSINVPHFSGYEITWQHNPPDTVLGHTGFKHNFIDWSSNTYSLDYLVEFWYFTVGIGGPEIEWGGELSIAWDNTVKRTCLVVATTAADTDYYFDLPPAPPTYWTHPV
jgi:hypothetical protein